MAGLAQRDAYAEAEHDLQRGTSRALHAPYGTQMTTCLVVDDNSFDRCMLRRCLGRDRPGLDLHEVDSIGAARAFLTRRTPDLILLDHRLPDGQGASFARELRAESRMSDVAIFVVTSADTRLLDPDVPAMSKDNLTPQGIWAMVDDFLAQRSLATTTPEAALVEAFGGAMQDSISVALARMLRTLRRAKTAARRSIPTAAMNDLDQLEEMLLALSDTTMEPRAASRQSQNRPVPPGA